MPNISDYALPIGIGVAILIFVIVIILSGYVKAPPDVAFIISGPRKKKKILIGRAGVRIPFIERKDILLLKQISIDIKTNGFVPTNDFIGVDIDAVAKVRVKTDPEGIELAMKNFLNMNEERICAALTDSLQGNMREIIGTVGLRELNTDRKKFGDEMQNKAQTDMNALGIEIISCNIQRIDDENGLIIALGQDNMSQIQKDASIAKAQADRDVAIAVAEAKQKANEASVQSDIIIAERNNDLAIKQANLKVQADTKKAEADAAYEIQKQEQQKVIGVKATDAEIAKTQQEAILRQKMVDVRQQELEAEINRKADADKYQKQKLAEAELIEKQKQAEAALYNQQKKSEAERVIAETEKYKAIQDAEAKKAQAEAQRYAAEQEAAGIKAKYDAEAMKKYGQAAILEMIVKVLPDVAKAVAEPLASIDKVTVFAGGDGSNGGVSGISANVPTVMAQTFETVKAATGVDLADIVKASGYDAKVTRNINVSGLDGEGKVADGVVAGAIADAVKSDPEEDEKNKD